MELKLSNVPATVANLIGFRPVIGDFNINDYPEAELKIVDEMSSKLLGRPYPKINRYSGLISLPDVDTCVMTNFEGGIGGGLSFLLRDSTTRLPMNGAVTNIVTIGNQRYFTFRFNSGTPLMYRTFNVVVRDSLNNIKYISRDITILPRDYANATILEFTSQRGVFHNFPYADAEPNQPQRFAIMANMRAFEYPDEKEVYKSVITGKTRTVNSTLERNFTIETYYQDFFAHEALAFAFFHDNIKVNGRDITVVESYETNSENDKDLTSGTVVVNDISFTTKTKPC